MMNMHGNSVEGQNQTAKAVDTFNKTRQIPKDFRERPDGIVAPERLKEPFPKIAITGRVDDKMFRSVSEALQEVDRKPGLTNGLQVDFSSHGGGVHYCFGVHDLLDTFARFRNIPVIITGYGPVMSAGALIIQAGTVRRMPIHSIYMLHPFSTRSEGPSADYLLATAEQTEREVITYCRIIAERSGLEVEEVRQMMEANSKAGTYLSAEEALAKGLIDEVI